jgi:FemAB-related protein (PEP-CTERM system-associated)
LPDAGALRVDRLDPANPAQVDSWDAFVQSCPEATFFHRSGWQTILRDVFRHNTYFLFAHADGKIQGVLPLGEIRSRLFGHSLTGLPFAVYGGAAVSNARAREALEREAQLLAQSLGAEHLELRHTESHHPDWPQQDLYVTFRKEILPTEEANMLALPRKQRAMVRKGIKLGLSAQVDANANRFFALYADNVRRHGTPAMPKRYFQALMDTFGADCEVLTVCSAEGVPLSSVLSFYFRDEVMPYYAGDDTAARDLAANDFKYWELMRRACARGLKVFDYGRSKVGTGPYAFKKNWGFEPKPLHYEYCLYKRDSIPQNNPNNAKYRLLIAAWKRLPLPVANWLGPFIVRNLG